MVFNVSRRALLMSPHAREVQLPHLAAVCRRPHHRVTSSTAKCGSELSHVRQRPVYAKLAEWMRVSFGLTACGLGGLVAAPDLCPPQKETLVRCKAVDARRYRLSCNRLMERQIGDLQTPKIGNRLAKDGFSVLEE